MIFEKPNDKSNGKADEESVHIKSVADLKEGVKKRWLIPLLLFAVMAAKWYLITQSEIVSQQYDSYGYVSCAENLSHSCGAQNICYPIWLWMSRQTGIPQRLAIEGLWLAAALAFSLTFARAIGARWWSVIVLAVLAFAPPTLFLFNRALTDGFSLCQILLLAAASLHLLTVPPSRRKIFPFAGSIGLLVGCMALTRTENIVLVPSLGFFVVAACICDRYHYRVSWPSILRKNLVLAGLIAIVAATPTVLILIRNTLVVGVCTMSTPGMPSHMALLKHLAAIDPGQPGQRFIPISRAAREMAYVASPTLARFKVFVEDPKNIYQQVTRDAYGTDGEIGAGWIWHVFNVAAPATGATRLSESDALYRRVIDELDAAFADGRLKRRFVLHPFLGGDARVWLPYLGDGVRRALQCTITPETPMLDQDYCGDVFDRVCLRRSSLVPKKTIVVSGWAFAYDSKNPIDRIDLLTPTGTSEISRLDFMQRLDIQQGFSSQGVEVHDRCGFFLVADGGIMPDRLSFCSSGRPIGTWSNLPIGKSESVCIRDQDGKPLIHAGIDQIKLVGPAWDTGWRSFVFHWLLKVGAASWVWLTALIAALVSIGWVLVKKRSVLIAPPGVFVMVLLVWAALRIFFYAVMSAGAWAAEPRYLQSTAIVALSAILIALALPWCHIPKDTKRE